MNRTDFKALLHRYNAGQCTEEEKELVESWYMQMDFSQASLTAEQIDGIEAMPIPVAPTVKRMPLWKWASVAAAVVIAVAASMYLMEKKQTVSPQTTIAVASDVLAPGKDKAVLTLANGKKITLDTVGSGVLGNEAHAMINKTAGNQLVYQEDGQASQVDQVVFNTMTTPRGGQYHLVLADGTKVWLNAASSITYPTRFKGGDRVVDITGEVYFEVAPRKDQPFKVRSRQQTVEVLGTHFNINTYDDEPTIKTTLLEGAVRIQHRGKVILLQPGEQSVVSAGGFKKSAVDVEEAIAWHLGDFVFKQQNVYEIMRTVSRWYDLEVDFENYKHTDQTFSGVVARSRNLSAVIQMMKKGTTLQFEIKGNKVKISN